MYLQSTFSDKFCVAQSCFLVPHVRLVTSRWNVYADDVHVLKQEGWGEGVGGENEETESSGASFVEQVLVVSRSVGRFDQFRKPKKQISCCCFEYSSFKAMPCYRCFILFLFKNTFVENTVHESALDFVEAVGDCVKHVNLHQVEDKWLAVPTYVHTRHVTSWTIQTSNMTSHRMCHLMDPSIARRTRSACISCVFSALR